MKNRNRSGWIWPFTKSAPTTCPERALGSQERASTLDNCIGRGATTHRGEYPATNDETRARLAFYRPCASLSWRHDSHLRTLHCPSRLDPPGARRRHPHAHARLDRCQLPQLLAHATRRPQLDRDGFAASAG